VEQGRLFELPEMGIVTSFSFTLVHWKIPFFKRDTALIGGRSWLMTF
jgi:hypothetical protein